ncbi:MAG TPA: (2Fe-2S)-binding protein [Acidimicrobiia bacterium]|nr:(2Fe-2S)-binding protein [Acidimicrobiia bacterium]
MRVPVTINGSERVLEVRAGDTLLEALRDNGYTSVKDGCANGDCGACSVLIDGRAVTSCLVFAAAIKGHEVTTVDALAGEDGTLHPLQQALLDAAGVQCGFCIPGIALTALDLLARHPHPTRGQIESFLAGNLCRCTGYVKQIEAIERYAAMEEEDVGAH